MQVKENLEHLDTNLQAHVGMHIFHSAGTWTSTLALKQHLVQSTAAPTRNMTPSCLVRIVGLLRGGMGGRGVTPVCTANCWGEFRVPSRRRHLHLPLWWLSPVCCFFISWVLAQAVNALGLYSWWKSLGTSLRSRCYCCPLWLLNVSRLCSVFCLQSPWLYFRANL